ncbi:hypothetical protein BDR03DRAFT_961741 [Suillus americanus]|nr:hypothetical protein BDR03DRAFT_961741 [Suillus americanus]
MRRIKECARPMVVVPALGRYSCLRGQWPRSGGVARKTRIISSHRARELDLGWDNALEGACCRHLLIGTEDLLQRALALLLLPVGSAKHLADLCVHRMRFTWRLCLCKDSE